MTRPAPTSETARIGPNAIVRMVEALVAVDGEAAAKRLLDAAALGHYAMAPPTAMVAEDEVARLMAEVARRHDPGRAGTIGWIAGQRTGDYLLANRIPQASQRVLRHLPAALAARVLLPAIGRHTWTFAGSAEVRLSAGNPVRIVLRDCVLCRGIARPAPGPCCSFYGGTFERLFRELVHEGSRVREIACIATGGPACIFEIAWPPLWSRSPAAIPVN